ncbi:hypothetical protein SUDANB121_05876 (plasmid) [Nocardiopsis dassonvillei]
MDREPRRKSWWRIVLDAIRTLGAVAAAIRLVAWLISLLEGGSS